MLLIDNLKSSIKCYIKPDSHTNEEKFPPWEFFLVCVRLLYVFMVAVKIFKKLAEKTAPPIARPLSIVYTYLVKMVSS